MNKPAKLDDGSPGSKEWWMPLARLGEPFISRVASELTGGLPYDPTSNREVRYWLVYSALARGDTDAARGFVQDWSKYRARPSEFVSKFNPGDHYHAMDRKFDTLNEAIEYLRRIGRAYAGLKEVHVYAKEGD